MSFDHQTWPGDRRAPRVATSLDSALAGAAPPAAARAGARGRRIDRALLGSVTALLALGLIIVYSASTPLGIVKFEDGAAFLKRQVAWILVGSVACAIASAIDLRVWRRWSVVGLVGSIAFLLLMLPFGQTANGAQRWVFSSMGGGSIQPSELAKLAVIIYLADWLSSKREDIRDVTMGLIPFSLVIGLVCGLVVMERHLSTAILIALVASWMFFTAGAHLGQMMGVGTLAGAVAALLVYAKPYRMARIRGYLDPQADRFGDGYQVDLSLRSFIGGGVQGLGLGRGPLKEVLPAAHTDAIFAVVGEELGLLGALVILALFCVLVWRGIKIAAGAPDRFSCLLATGITCWIATQALLNMGVATGRIPPTGISLPFISYGGSNLVTTLLGIGILMRISKHSDFSQAKLHVPVDFWRGQRRARLSRAHRLRRRDP